MGELVSERRFDRTGKLVTRHVRQASVPGNVKTMPAPSIALQKSQSDSVLNLARKPTAKQRDSERVRFVSIFTFPCDSMLGRALEPEETKIKVYEVQSTDIALYEMMSIMKPGNAFMMMRHGIVDTKRATAFLNEHGLENLIEVRSAVMSSAVDRRLDPLAVAEMDSMNGMDNYSTEVFLDAVEASSSVALSRTNVLPSIPDQILRGQLSLSDIKEVGISVVAKSQAQSRLLDSLKNIKAGTANYDAEFLALAAKQFSHGTAGYMQDILRLADVFGGEFLSEGRFLSRALTIHVDWGSDDPEYFKSLVRYDNALIENGEMLRLDECRKLHDAGVSPEDAVHLTKSGMKADQIIAIKVHGVNIAISDGWI